MSVFNLDNLERIMVFGAHPDDETIGVGGIIHKFSSKGKRIIVITFTDGRTAANSHEEYDEMIAKRKKEMRKTDEISGIDERVCLDIPSQQVYSHVYTNNSLHHKLISLIRQYNPQLLFTHSKDNHRDHNAVYQITNESAFQASENILENLGEPVETPRILHYGIELNILQNFIFRISKEDLEAKLKALSSQLSQTREGYLQRFEQIVESRAKELGASYFGVGEYAEGFYLDKRTPIKIG